MHDERHLERTLNKTKRHNPVVVVCMKNAAASRRVDWRNDGFTDGDSQGRAIERPVAGMANKALKGSATTTLFASSLSEATRTLIYIEPIAIAQLPRNKQIANVFAIMDRLISPRNTRDSTSIDTSPSPDS